MQVIKRYSWALVIALALLVAAIAAYAPGVDAASTTPPQQRIYIRAVPNFYWSGFYRWDGTYCTGLFSDSGRLLLAYC